MGLFGRDQPPSPQGHHSPAAPPRTPPRAVEGLSIVARPNRFEGALSGGGDIQIDGELKGEVDSSGRLVIAESGKVEAKMHARQVEVSGTVTGDVTADDKIELKASAVLRGNITAPKVVIHEGATFEGQVFMKAPAGRRGEKAGEKPVVTGAAFQTGSARGDKS